MIIKKKWLLLLLCLVGCSSSANVADPTIEGPTDETPNSVISNDTEIGDEPVSSEPATGEYGPGLVVGTKAPNFTLKNQSGEDVSLSSLLESAEYVALVFYRSADW